MCFLKVYKITKDTNIFLLFLTVIVFADVTFDEFSLYFKSQYSSLSPSNLFNTPSTFSVPIVCDPLTVSPPPLVPAP